MTGGTRSFVVSSIFQWTLQTIYLFIDHTLFLFLFYARPEKILKWCGLLFQHVSSAKPALRKPAYTVRNELRTANLQNAIAKRQPLRAMRGTITSYHVHLIRTSKKSRKRIKRCNSIDKTSQNVLAHDEFHGIGTLRYEIPVNFLRDFHWATKKCQNSNHSTYNTSVWW